jgi:urea transporter
MFFTDDGIYFKFSEALHPINNGRAFRDAYLPPNAPALILFCPSVAVPSTLIAQVFMQFGVPFFVLPYVLVIRS